MENARNAAPSARPRRAKSSRARSSSSKESAASIRGTLVKNGPLQPAQDEQNGVDDNDKSSDDDDAAPASQPAAESSAYALLALMTTAMQQSTRASADERGRTNTNDTYSSWKAATPTKHCGSDDEDDAACDPKHHGAKKRKPTHTVRKEEISALSDEVAQLQQRLAFLRGEIVAPYAKRQRRSRSSDANDAETLDDLVSLDDDPEHPSIPNALLRDAIHEQQLSLACARSMMSHFFTSNFALPAHCYIHLTKSRSDRLRTLQAVKPQQLRIARRYVLERSRHLNLTKPHAASEQFVTESGDACTIRFALVQLPGSVSVRQVFEAATFYTSNLEISFTDGAGRLTIRENEDENDDPTVVHHRVLTTVRPDLHVEAKLVMFTHFDEDEDFGLVTSTFVDRDDLHPYNSRDRIRMDVTAVLMISREKNCVVMRRQGHVRVHHNATQPVSNELAKALSEGVSDWGDALVKHARQHCGLDNP